MARSGWWTRTRGLPREAYDSWVASLTGEGREARVLAWATTEDGYVVASPSAVSVREQGTWSHVGWHEIERGGWDAQTGQLTWSPYEGERWAVALSEPGRLPEVFRERVAASIVLEQLVPLAGRRGVLISGRRDLSRSASPIVWHSQLGGGVGRQEGVAATVEEALARVRSEYDVDGRG